MAGQRGTPTRTFRSTLDGSIPVPAYLPLTPQIFPSGQVGGVDSRVITLSIPTLAANATTALIGQYTLSDLPNPFTIPQNAVGYPVISIVPTGVWPGSLIIGTPVANLSERAASGTTLVTLQPGVHGLLTLTLQVPVIATANVTATKVSFLITVLLIGVPT